MIRHASVYDRDRPTDHDGWRVLVMRRWPRGVRRERIDVWLKDAGPSLPLLHAYTHAGLGWAAFERRYRSELLDERPHIIEQLLDLEREHGLLTLFCRERVPPAQQCHREILVELLTAAHRDTSD
jgi:uncharacterized protein YeaO (DUF488 family)